MSEIIEVFADMIKIIADNPASILIVLGFFSILLAILVPMGAVTQLLLGGLGFFMMIVGIFAHIVWLQR